MDWSNFTREVCVDYCFRSSVSKLGGPGRIVEIDEAKIGHRKYNRGRIIEGQWIFGGIDRTTKNLFLVPVEKRDAETLINLIMTYIAPETTIMSDCWAAYRTLSSNPLFEHLTVNQSVNFVDPDNGAHTNTIVRTWREVRANVPRFGQRREHFHGYLCEYIFKRKFQKFIERIHAFYEAASVLYNITENRDQ